MTQKQFSEPGTGNSGATIGAVPGQPFDDIGYVDGPGGRIAYVVTGEGPLVVLSPGIGDLRQAYRFLTPLLVKGGYRVAAADMRGHGDSTMGWQSISRSDVAGDLLSLIRKLGGPAVIIGHSLSGGAATIAAAQSPDLVRAIVELNPATRAMKPDLKALMGVRRYRRTLLLLVGTMVFRSSRLWFRYMDLAYPHKPADWDDYIAALRAKLAEPGRMSEFMKTMKTNASDAEAHLPGVRCPALIVMGGADPDFPDPKAEGEAIIAALPSGLGTLKIIDGAGHYLHAECPDELASLVISFLADGVDA